MKTAYKYLIRLYLGPLILTFFISLFILLMQFLWKYIDEMVGKGLEWHIVAQLLFYASSSFVMLALPLAVLLSSIMVFGNMGEHFELTAFKSSGISLLRVMKPLIILIFCISIGMFIYANYVSPIMHLKFIALLSDIRRKKPDMDIKEGIFTTLLDNYSIKISKKNSDNNNLENVIIYDHSANKGNTSVTVADSAKMEINSDKTFFILTLFNGKTYEEDSDAKNRKTKPFQISSFNIRELSISLEEFGFNRIDSRILKNNASMMNVNQLSKKSKELDSTLIVHEGIFYKMLVKSNFFNKETEANRMDSLFQGNIINDTTNVIDIDSIYLSYDKEGKEKIIQYAIEDVRNSQNRVNSQHDKLIHNKKQYAKYLIEWHKKFSLSFTCLVFFFIGAPFGIIVRKGGLGMPLVASIFLFLIYYTIAITAEKMVKSLELIPIQGMWASSIILFPLGIFLTYKAVTDSSILNLDSYYLFFNKLKIYFNLKIKNKKIIERCKRFLL